VTKRIEDEWGPHLAEMMQDPEFRVAYSKASAEPDPVLAFAKPVRVLIYVTAVLALSLAVAVVGWVLVQMWALR
jgi:hypothetical protein